MNFLPRPSATGTAFYDYDWTGLHLLGYSRSFGDPTFYQDVDVPNQYGGSGPGSDWYWYYDFGYDFGYYTGTSGAKLAFTGSSTYKWQWTPPNKRDAQGNDLGTPDLSNFPVPTLFFLARLQGRISGDLFYTGDMGITVDGKLTDEWTPANSIPVLSGSVNPHLEAKSGNAQNAYASYGIRSASLDPADATQTTLLGTLSPTPYVTGMGPDYYCPDAEVELQLHEHAFSLELTDTNQQGFNTNGGAATLNLFGYAQKLGDGKNQFVYDTNANLFLPMGVKLNGAPNDQIAADADYLIHGGEKIKFVTDLTYAVPENFFLAAVNNNIVPQTAANNFAGYEYRGLPVSNNDLGNHVVKLQVKSGTSFQDSELAHIQTFFHAQDVTHPVNNPNDVGIPNWLYYYRQVFAPTCNWVYEPTGANNPAPSYYMPNTDTIHITDSADVQTTNFHVFALPNGEQYVKWIGDLQVKGLYRYIKAAAHEQGHHNDSLAGIEGGLPDGDGDGISDIWESNHHFKTNEQDTTGAYGDMNGTADAGKGDRECLCDIQALGALVAAWQNGALLKDWADNGALYGRLPWPASQAQWTFTPRDDMGNMGTPTNIIPANALIALP